MNTIGERLRQARVAAGLSMRELARKAAPLSAAAISKYERGEDRPSPAVLARLARALGIRTEYLFRSVSVSLSCPSYRKHHGLGVKAQASIEAKVREALERYLELEQSLPADRRRPFAMLPEQDRRVEDLSDAERVASRLRDIWHLGLDPIENVADTLEDNMVRVILLDEDDHFDGFSCWANGEIPVVVANARKPGDRIRYDMAHELAHLLLAVGPGVDEERAAHRFAGAFLAPAEAIRRDLGQSRRTLGIAELGLLKRKYGLSIQALVMRARHVGVITPAAATTIFRTLTAQGLRRAEPSEYDVPPETPSRPRLLASQAVAEGFLTPARAAQLLGAPVQPARPTPSPGHLRAAAAEAAASYLTDSDLNMAELGTEDVLDA